MATCVCPARWTACLHEWTLMNSDTFWASALLYSALLSHTPYRPICSGLMSRAAHDSALLEHMNKAPGLRINHGLVRCFPRDWELLRFTCEQSARGHWRFLRNHTTNELSGIPVTITSSRLIKVVSGRGPFQSPSLHMFRKYVASPLISLWRNAVSVD